MQTGASQVSTTPKKGVPNSEGTQWKKGQSGNLAGRPPLPQKLKKVDGVAAEEARRLFAFYGRKTVAELRILATDETLEGIDYNIVLAILDPKQFPFYLDRMYGKVADKVEQVSVNVQYDAAEMEEIPLENLLKVASDK